MATENPFSTEGALPSTKTRWNSAQEHGPQNRRFEYDASSTWGGRASCEVNSPSRIAPGKILNSSHLLRFRYGRGRTHVLVFGHMPAIQTISSFANLVRSVTITLMGSPFHTELLELLVKPGTVICVRPLLSRSSPDTRTPATIRLLSASPNPSDVQEPPTTSSQLHHGSFSVNDYRE